MSNALDTLAQQHERDVASGIGAITRHVTEASQAGMPVNDIVANFRLPDSDENPYKAVASLFLGQNYNVEPQRAYGMYDMLKKNLYRDITDEELLEKLINSDGMPKSTITPEFHKAQAKEEKETEFDTYEEKRAEMERLDAEREAEHARKEMETATQQIKPLLKDHQRRMLDDDFFGKGNQRRKIKEKYFDALYKASTPEEEAEATRKYVHNLGVEQQHRNLETERMEYQIENRTWEDTRGERAVTYLNQGLINLRGGLGRMGEIMLKGVDKLPNTAGQQDWIDGTIATLKNDMRVAHYQANAGELWRPERDWIDGATRAILTNTPNMIVSMAAAMAASPGGPVAMGMATFYTMGSMESSSIYAECMANGFDEQESNARANVGFVINGGIEAAFGGGAKYLPGLKKKVAFGLAKHAGRFGMSMLKEIMEEIPQEITSAILTGNTPFNKDGTLDGDEVVNQILLVARDAAFMSGAFTSVQKMSSKVGDGIFRLQNGMGKQDVLAYMDQYEKYVKSEKLDTKDDLKVKDGDIAEDMSAINKAPQYALKDLGGDKYTLVDTDTGIEYDSYGEPVKGANKGMSGYEAGYAMDEANLNQKPSDDPIIQFNRYLVSRSINGVIPKVFEPMATMTSPKSTHAARVSAAQKLSKHISKLRTDLIAERDEEQAEAEIPFDTEQKILALPELLKKSRSVQKGLAHFGFITKQEKIDIVDGLRRAMRIDQLWGDGVEAVKIRNRSRATIKKIKPNKHQKPIMGVKDIKSSKLMKLKDALTSTTKDDVYTSWTHILGFDAIPFDIMTQGARTAANAEYRQMNKIATDFQKALGITMHEKKSWSDVVGHKTRLTGKAKQISVYLGGELHPLNMAQIMFLNLAMRDAKFMKIMKERGVSLEGFEFGHLKDSDVKGLQEVLHRDKKAEAFVNKMHDFYIDERGARVNKASQIAVGVDTVSNKDYMPDVRPIKPDTHMKSGPLAIKDIFSAITEDLRTAANYIKISPMLREVNGIIYNEEFTRAAQNAGKKKYLDRLREHYIAMGKPRPDVGTNLERLLSKIGAQRARSILANGRIVFLQAGSYQLYANETDAKYLAGGVAPKEIIVGWDFYEDRKGGQGSIHSVMSENSIRSAWNGTQAVDYTMYPMHRMDLKIVRQAGNIAWREMNSKHLGAKARRWWGKYLGEGKSPADFKKMSPEFMDALHARATYLAMLTQPMFFPESRNSYIQAGGAFMREIARFRSFTDQLLRTNARQIALWRQGEVSTREMAQNTAQNIVWATMWYNGLKWAFDAIWKDEDKENKDLLTEILLGPLTWIPMVGWSLKGAANLLIEGNGYGPSDFSTITFDQLNHTKDSAMTIMQAVKYSLNDERDARGRWKSEKYWESGTRSAAEDVGVLFFGLPLWLMELYPEDTKKKGKSEMDDFKVSTTRRSSGRKRGGKRGKF